VGGHAISVAAMMVLLAAGRGATLVLAGGALVPVGRLLWGAIALDLVILAVLTWLGWTARAAARAAGQQRPAPGWTVPRHRPADGALRVALRILGVLFLAGAVIYEAGALLPGTRDAYTNLPFVTNSVVKVGTLALVAFYAARDLGPRIGVVGILCWAHAVSVIVQLLFWLGARTEQPMVMTAGGYTLIAAVRDTLLAGAALDAVIAALLFWLRRRAYRGRFDPTFLSLRGYRSLIALSEVVVHGPDEQVSPVTMAQHVDRYFGGMRAKRRIVHQVALVALHFHPLLYLQPPLCEMGFDTRLDHLRRHFQLALVLRLIPKTWRRWVRGLIRVGQQLAYVGYYNDPAVDRSVGYVRFKDRERVRPPVPDPGPHPLQVTLPADVADLHWDADAVVIGSGAAGAILAYRLAEQGRDVLLLERGRYVEPRHFSDDEVGMMGLLYDEGVFQQTRDLRFTILQGSCVGGTTVVNNAVCFDPPARVVEHWNDKWRWNASVRYDELIAAAAVVRRWLPVQSQRQAPLNPSAREYLDGVAAHRAALDVDAVDANIHDCLGCGYCNIGCKWGRKLSMLDTVLPWSQRQFPGKVRIVAECSVQRLIEGRRGAVGRRIGVVRAQLADGRLVTIQARTVIVAAGAIASSWILMQSGIGQGLPVGRGLSFNMGAALTAEFPRRMNAYDGLQISHYGIPRPERGWVVETWWNPPVAQALNMPGWFERHYENMRRYPYLMAAGALVGTEPNANLGRALTGGPDVIYDPAAGDRRKLADALIELGHTFFAAGATRVMVNSLSYHEFTHPNQLPELTAVLLDPEEIGLGTGHPQGGNAISASPGRGVVNPELRVHGWENLYVCDASVIPSSLTVNPQLTVMALAQYAAPGIR
jgi:choline dehydrogenase-like flavoprotein